MTMRLGLAIVLMVMLVSRWRRKLSERYGSSARAQYHPQRAALRG